VRLTCFFVLICTLMMHAKGNGQPCKTEAKSVSTKIAFAESIKNNPAKKLVELKKVIPDLQLDLRYATNNNFTHTVLYTHPIAYMREAPANALKQVQDELRKKGYALKIYDAFRPFSVTCKIWRMATDRHYVANPKKGSNHNRGLAADLTLIDLKTGKELDMGTGFDNFSDTAAHAFKQLPEQVLVNRKLLKYTMWKHGFGQMPNEWWHYQWHNDQDYEIIDLDFDELKGVVQ
jgi:D-alanyl-D-alanine dipeptidase